MGVNLNAVKKQTGYIFEFKSIPYVDGLFIKQLRAKLQMSQSMFAQLLNVKKKTIEKWEQGKNPVSNGNAVLAVLFDRHPELVDEFIVIQKPFNVYIEYEMEFKHLNKDHHTNVLIDCYEETPNHNITNWVNQLLTLPRT